jgi:prolyl oligopeptidase
MPPRFAVALFAMTVCPGFSLAADVNDDPYTWLEEIEGAKAIEWAKAENVRSLAVLENDARFKVFRDEARTILTSPSRLPLGEIHQGNVYNFWQDEQHVRGVWRRASVDGYRKGKADWETLIDYDRLAADEKENWVAGAIVCLEPQHRRCMVELSRGGGDTSTWREFDTTTRRFVPGGFALPEAKSNLDWVDGDTLLVGTAWGPNSLTTSGYPRTIKVWHRSTALASAETLFDGERTDVGVQPLVDHDDAGAPTPFVVRAVSFFEFEHYYAAGLGAPQKLPLPRNADLKGVLDGRAIFSLREAWRYRDRDFPNGAIVAYALKDGAAELVFAPSDTQSVETVDMGETGLVVQYLDNVSGHAARITRTPQGQWQVREIALPGNGVVKLVSAGGGTDAALVTFESLTTPPTLHYVDAANKVETVLSVPAAYDASAVVVTQRFAKSRDGTRVPYFVMGRKDALARGNAPTVQYAYGGFLAPTLPVYYEDPSRPQHGALAGKLWVSRGGVLVLSNIRGGSEYGPRWHQEGLRENRQKVFDDFIAISEDLIRSGVTSRSKLGALGRSNGGLLMGVITNQRPDLYGAIVNGVPLFDMKRYTKLGAGASWIAEYGDPDTADWNYMSKWSPYQNLRGTEVRYPPVFFYTSTKDDRVHPGHARKAAAKMKALGHEYLFWENMEGGHGGASNQDQLSYRIALEYTFLARQLMGTAP